MRRVQCPVAEALAEPALLLRAEIHPVVADQELSLFTRDTFSLNLRLEQAKYVLFIGCETIKQQSS